MVADLTELWAVAEIDETEIPLVEAGRDVEVRVAAYPGETFGGRITAVCPDEVANHALVSQFSFIANQSDSTGL